MAFVACNEVFYGLSRIGGWIQDQACPTWLAEVPMQRQIQDLVPQHRRFGTVGMDSAVSDPSSCLVGSAGNCCISRDGMGRYLVQRCDQPSDQWVAANLPSAHALCQQIVNGPG
jgi:hypothetical protein